MEMGVKAGGQAVTVEQTKPRTDRRNSSELDLWLEKAEAMGELKRITAEVSCDLEAAHITYLVGLEKSPALLFENIKGHPGQKALYNMIGCNLSRFCLMIGEEPVDHPLKAVQLLQKKLGRKMAPVTVPADPSSAAFPLAGALILAQGLVEIVRCVMCLKTGEWPSRLEDVEEVDVEKLKEMVHVKDEDIASLSKGAAK